MMDTNLVMTRIDGAGATVSLDDPARRNALGLPMFDALDEALQKISADVAVNVVVLRGEGTAFCAGFDLGAAVKGPAIMGVYIERLSGVLKALRRMPQVVVACVHGAAIAGGCALLSACDFVCIDEDVKLGYPVHALGVSPAVSLPTLMQIVGDGPSRALVMSGELINGAEAGRIQLASHVSTGNDEVQDKARSLAEKLATHGHEALRITKAWMNELDASLADGRFDAPVQGSVGLATENEAVERLRAFWSSRGSA